MEKIQPVMQEKYNMKQGNLCCLPHANNGRF